MLRGGRHARWDLEVRGGFLGAARLLMGVEEHAGGKQLIRLRWWPDAPLRGPVFALAFGALAAAAAHDHAWPVAVMLGACALLPAVRTIEQCMTAMTTVRGAVARLRDGSG